MVCSAVPCAASGVIGTAPCAKEKQKRDVQLDHLRAPIFVFSRKTLSVIANAMPAPPKGGASLHLNELCFLPVKSAAFPYLRIKLPLSGELASR